MSAPGKALVSASEIEQSILPLRGHKVLLDSTLAALYGVQTKVLVQAVQWNRALSVNRISLPIPKL